MHNKLCTTIRSGFNLNASKCSKECLTINKKSNNEDNNEYNQLEERSLCLHCRILLI